MRHHNSYSSQAKPEPLTRSDRIRGDFVNQYFVKQQDDYQTATGVVQAATGVVLVLAQVVGVKLGKGAKASRFGCAGCWHDSGPVGGRNG